MTLVPFQPLSLTIPRQSHLKSLSRHSAALQSNSSLPDLLTCCCSVSRALCALLILEYSSRPLLVQAYLCAALHCLGLAQATDHSAHAEAEDDEDGMLLEMAVISTAEGVKLALTSFCLAAERHQENEAGVQPVHAGGRGDLQRGRHAAGDLLPLQQRQPARL